MCYAIELAMGCTFASSLTSMLGGFLVSALYECSPKIETKQKGHVEGSLTTISLNGTYICEDISNSLPRNTPTQMSRVGVLWFLWGGYHNLCSCLSLFLFNKI